MNGHIKVTIPVQREVDKELKTVDLPVGIKFNMYAAENISSIKGNPTQGTNIIRMVWAGVLGNAFVKQLDEPEVTFEEVADWVEHLTFNGDADNILDQVAKTFLEAEPIAKLIEKSKQREEEESKKKDLIGSTSTA